MNPLFRQGLSAKAKFIFFVLLALVTMLVDSRFRVLDGFRGTMLRLTSPILEAVSLPAQLVTSGGQYFASKAKLQIENRQLRLENEHLQLQAVRIEELRAENENLRKTLNAVPRHADNIVTAEILDRVADPFTQRIKINAGEENGIKVGMPVLCASGVFGQISRTMAHQSEVVLLTDHRQQLAVVNSRTRERFILAGSGDTWLRILFADPSADIKEGDRLTTTGLDPIFPKNIPVAIVTHTSYSPGEIYRQVLAMPEANPAEMQFATVVLNEPQSDALEEQNSTYKTKSVRNLKRHTAD